MLNPTERFPEESLRALLANRWNVQVTELEYVPVGFGTHHWSARDLDGERWFVNVDELPDDPSAPGVAATRFQRLGNALGVARTLRDDGHAFVAAPEPTADGHIVVRLDAAFAVSVYAYLDGESFGWDDWDRCSAEHRAAILAILTELHAVPADRRGPADIEDFAIRSRDVLEQVLADGGPAEPTGPYTERATALITGRSGTIRGLLKRYDDLAALGRSRPERFVLTHGEPHPGNTMLVDGRYLLIDWESALLAPPERDLWNFGLGDPLLCELYSLRWDLAETALCTDEFTHPHSDAANERLTWQCLVDTAANLETTAARI
jgi:spectinomycin phosphotransferase/16S rRNA (guanine(1405)-N(7))-methyltransferase